MANYKSEEAGIMLMSLAKILVMEHEPSEVAAHVKENERSFAVAGTAALVSWLGEFITYLALDDMPEEEVVDE